MHMLISKSLFCLLAREDGDIIFCLSYKHSNRGDHCRRPIVYVWSGLLIRKDISVEKKMPQSQRHHIAKRWGWEGLVWPIRGLWEKGGAFQQFWLTEGTNPGYLLRSLSGNLMDSTKWEEKNRYIFSQNWVFVGLCWQTVAFLRFILWALNLPSHIRGRSKISLIVSPLRMTCSVVVAFSCLFKVTQEVSNAFSRKADYHLLLVII